MKKILLAFLFLIPGITLAQTTSVVQTTNDTTTNNTSVSTNDNTNTNFNIQSGTITNNNNNVNTSTSTSTNTNTNNNVMSGAVTYTNNNNNVSTSTATNTNMNTNVNTSTSTATNTNINTNVNTSTTTAVSDNRNVNINESNNNNRNFNENVSKIEQEVKSPPPSAIAPTMMSYSQDVCTSGVSGAVQTQVVGISAGKAVRDENCERLKLSKALYDMGMKVASVALMCQDERVFKAMEMAGTPCPYMGKIGKEATAAWAENAETRPEQKKGFKFPKFNWSKKPEASEVSEVTETEE